MKTILLSLLFSFLIILGGSYHAVSQTFSAEEEKSSVGFVENIDDKEDSASSLISSNRKNIGPTYIITSDEIQQLGIMTVVDALRLVPGVHVQLNEMKSKVTIRGTGDYPYTSRVLFLIDGIPINSPDMGTYPGLPMDHFLPAEEVERIEVCKGPASARWGPSAMWGSVNIISKRGAMRHGEQHDSAPETEQTVSAEGGYICPMKCEGEKVYPNKGTCPVCGMNLEHQHDVEGSRMGMFHYMMSPEGEPMATVTYGGQKGDLLYSLTGQFMVHGGELEVLEEEFEHRSNQTFLSLNYKNFDFMMNYLQDNSTPFTFRGGDNAGDEAAFHEKDGVDMMSHPPREDIEFTTTGTRERLLSYFTGYEGKVSPNATFKTRLSYQHKTGSSCGACHTGTGTQNPFALTRVPWAGNREIIERGETVTERYFASGELLSDLTAKKIKQFITAGVDSRIENVEKKDGVMATLNDHYSQSKQIGAYLQDDITLFKNHAVLSLAGRYDYLTEFDNEFSWSSSLQILPSDNLNLAITARRGYNPPTWDQMNMAMIIMSEIPALVVGANEAGTALWSEEIRSFDLNVRYNPHPKISLTFDGYISQVNNFIDRNGTPPSYKAVPPPMIFVWKNKSETIDINGFELSLTCRLSNRFRGSVAWAFQKTDTPTAPDGFVFGSWPYKGAPYAPPNKLYLKFFSQPFKRIHLNANAVWIDKQWPQFHMFPSPAIYHNYADTDRVLGKPLDSFTLIDLSCTYQLPIQGNMHIGLKVTDLLNRQPTEYRHHLQDPSNREGLDFQFMVGWMW